MVESNRWWRWKHLGCGWLYVWYVGRGLGRGLGRGRAGASKQWRVGEVLMRALIGDNRVLGSKETLWQW